MRALLEAGATLRGQVHVPDTAIALTGFSTVGLPSASSAGKIFFEVELVTVGSYPQIGWASEAFVCGANAPAGEGVGDDDDSWGADGARKMLWHSGSAAWDVEWADGDVIGVAADLTAGTIWFGKNGSWTIGFSDVQATRLYPALTGSGLICCVRLGDECRLPAPDETFAPCPPVGTELEVLRGGEHALLTALPSLRRGLDCWLLAKGSGSDACVALIAEWVAKE